MDIKISVLGSINYDLVATASRLPKIGETVDGFGVKMYVGGKGANQAVQSALLGAQTYFIGCVGDDRYGSIVRDGIASKGVNVQHLTSLTDCDTGNATIYVDLQGDNMLVYSPGANQKISTTNIDNAKSVIENSDIFITQNEVNADAIKYGLTIAKKAGVRTVLNPAPAVEIADDVFKLVDYFTPNETESEAYTKIYRSDIPIDEWKRANAQWFLKKGVANVCITMGEKGAYFYNGKEELSMDAFCIKTVDTTAAGDAFNAGFAYGIAKGLSTKECVRMGSACGAIATQTTGAQNSLCDINKVMDFLEKHRSML